MFQIYITFKNAKTSPILKTIQNKIKKKKSFTLTLKIKYLGINLVKEAQDLSRKNYKTSLKKVKKNV